MDNTFCLAWPIFVLMEVLVDIDVIFSYHTSTGKSPLTITGVTRVTFRARLRLMITHFGKENVFSKEYQLLYSTDLLVDLSEAMPEADKIHHSQDFAPLPSSEVNMAVQIILTLTDDDIHPLEVSCPEVTVKAHQMLHILTVSTCQLTMHRELSNR